MSGDERDRSERRRTTLVLPPNPVAPRQKHACLMGVGGTVLGQRLLIEPMLELGRGPTSGFPLAGDGVSTRHAQFRLLGDRVYVEDLDSTNGTWVNGRRIEGATELANDDLVQLGGELLRFRWSDDLEVALYEQLVREATRDALTGLCNRRHFYAELERDLGRAVRARRTLSVLFVDIDHFKRVNDTWGHSVGDDVLREVGRRIEGAVRTTDIAARYGGEEFVVMLPDAMLSEASQVAERIRQVVREEAVRLPGTTHEVTVSIGVAELAEVQPPARLESADDTNRLIQHLLQLADRRLYEAKSAGRDRVKGWG